jgi:hypothetical protein
MSRYNSYRLRYSGKKKIVPLVAVGKKEEGGKEILCNIHIVSLLVWLFEITPTKRFLFRNIIKIRQSSTFFCISSKFFIVKINRSEFFLLW